MDLAELQTELARFTYKPGWTLSAEQNHEPFRENGGPKILRIRYEAPDSRNPNQTIPIKAHFLIPDDDSVPFWWWLQNVLFDVELHESREWLRRDGELVDDPHAQDERVIQP